MKKSYLTPSITVVEYNVVDIVTASNFDLNGFSNVKENWIEDILGLN